MKARCGKRLGRSVLAVVVVRWSVQLVTAMIYLMKLIWMLTMECAKDNGIPGYLMIMPWLPEGITSEQSGHRGLRIDFSINRGDLFPNMEGQVVSDADV